MGKLELVEVKLESHGFSFYVVNLPEDQLEEKLAFISPETGLISRAEYQNYIFADLIVNVERLFRFVAEATGGDTEEQIELRDKIAQEVYKVNPEVDPANLILTKGGLIKPSSSAEGKPLVENSDWEKVIDDINPYVVIEEFEILDHPPFFPPEDEGDEPPFLARYDTVERSWKRLGVTLNVRKFSPDDLPFIFGPEVSFAEQMHYQIHIIQKCIDKAESVFALCDATGLTDELKIPAITEELYQICIDVNPFLKAEDVDLEEIRAGNKKRRRRSPSPKKKRGSGRRFADVKKDELLTLAERMNKRIIGQSEAVDKIVDTIQIASCGLKNPEAPIAVYMMCGTTGVGKTLTAKVLAEELCGSKDNLVRVDCSEYTQQHDVQKLIGAPPSYVGYEDGGFLTNAIQENPFSVVLFDEIEKAHNKLFDLLLQIMDDARLTDGKGNVTDFKDCVVLLTSNIGVSEAEGVKQTMGFGDLGLLTDSRREEALRAALKNRFRPEFLNRIDETLSFRSLSKGDAYKVIDLLLEKVKGYLLEKRISAEFTDNVREMIFNKGFSKKFGARPLQRTIDKEIIRSLAKMILSEEVHEGSKIRVDFKNDKLVVREIKPKLKKTAKKPNLIKA